MQLIDLFKIIHRQLAKHYKIFFVTLITMHTTASLSYGGAVSCKELLKRPQIITDHFENKKLRTKFRKFVKSRELISKLPEMRYEAQLVLEQLTELEMSPFLDKDSKPYASHIRNILEKDFSYNSYIEASLNFLALASKIDMDSTPLNEDSYRNRRLKSYQSLPMSTWLENVKTTYQQGVDSIHNYVQEAEYAILLPTARKLTPRQLMTAFGSGIFPLGLSASPVNVDGEIMHPGHFFHHDLFDHTTPQLYRVAQARIETGGLIKFEEINDKILEKISQEIDLQKRERLDYLWFYLIHERSYTTEILETGKIPVLNEDTQNLFETLSRKLQGSETEELRQTLTMDETLWHHTFKQLEQIIHQL